MTLTLASVSPVDSFTRSEQGRCFAREQRVKTNVDGCTFVLILCSRPPPTLTQDELTTRKPVSLSASGSAERSRRVTIHCSSRRSNSRITEAHVSVTTLSLPRKGGPAHRGSVAPLAR